MLGKIAQDVFKGKSSSLISVVLVMLTFFIHISWVYAALPSNSGGDTATGVGVASNPCNTDINMENALGTKGKVGGLSTNDIVKLDGSGVLEVMCAPLVPGEQGIVTYIDPSGHEIKLAKGSTESANIEDLIAHVRSNFDRVYNLQYGLWSVNVDSKTIVGENSSVPTSPIIRAAFGVPDPIGNTVDALDFVIKSSPYLDFNTALSDYKNFTAKTQDDALSAIEASQNLVSYGNPDEQSRGRALLPVPERENLFMYLERMYPPANISQRMYEGRQYGDPQQLDPLPPPPDRVPSTFDKYPALKETLSPPPTPIDRKYYTPGYGVFDIVERGVKGGYVTVSSFASSLFHKYIY